MYCLAIRFFGTPKDNIFIISSLQARKAQGIKLGRPQGKGKSKLDAHKDDIIKMLSYGVPKTMIAKQYNTSVGNLYNFLDRLKECS